MSDTEPDDAAQIDDGGDLDDEEQNDGEQIQDCDNSELEGQFQCFLGMQCRTKWNLIPFILFWQ